MKQADFPIAADFDQASWATRWDHTRARCLVNRAKRLAVIARAVGNTQGYVFC